MFAFDLFLQEITYKEFLGAAATLLSFGMFIPYFRQMIKKEIHPHAFTWLLWGILSAVIWFAQFTEEGGAGAWLTGFEALACFSVALFSIRNGFGYIAKSDWAVFVTSLFALPIWWITESPLASVILITGIDVLSFYPTFRKTYALPFDESAAIYLSGGVELFLALMAMDAFCAVTVINPLFNLILHVALGILILARQHSVRAQKVRLMSKSYSTAQGELIQDRSWTLRRQRRQERLYAHALRAVSMERHCMAREAAHRWYNAA